jgi:hypothetical protein
MAKAYDQFSEVTAYGGEVLIDGPKGIAFSLTPAAAREMGYRLYHQSSVAGDQSEHVPLSDPDPRVPQRGRY